MVCVCVSGALEEAEFLQHHIINKDSIKEKISEREAKTTHVRKAGTHLHSNPLDGFLDLLSKADFKLSAIQCFLILIGLLMPYVQGKRLFCD